MSSLNSLVSLISLLAVVKGLSTFLYLFDIFAPEEWLNMEDDG